jgi:phthalate 4,5-cis-dihydrodiol dehydrogenase
MADTANKATTLRVGIVGLGTASTQVLPFFGKLPHIVLGAGADVRPEARDAFTKKYGAPAFAGIEDICRRDDIDAVWIATPNDLHAEHVVLAANHGKHVVCEKPMALSMAECDRMIAAAERNGVKLLQGHSKIYNAPIRKIGEIVRSGVLGRVVQIDTWNFNDWLQRPRLASEVDTARGGGICYRQGPHQVDIVRYIGGGRVKSVRASVGRYDPHFDTEGSYQAFLTFEDGASATLVLNGYGFFDVAELTWGIGESGRPKSEGDLRSAKPRLTGALPAAEKYALAPTHGGGGERPNQPFFGLTVVSCEKGVIRQSPQGLYIYDADGCREIPCPSGRGRGDELIELDAAIRENRPAFPDGRWGKATLEVCLAMLESSRLGQDVVLRHQNPVAVGAHAFAAVEA